MITADAVSCELNFVDLACKAGIMLKYGFNQFTTIDFSNFSILRQTEMANKLGGREFKGHTWETRESAQVHNFGPVTYLLSQQ